MRPEVWEELGETGIKTLLALLELGGEGDYIRVASQARIGKSSWQRLSSVLTKYGLVEYRAEAGKRGQLFVMRLTPKGFEVARLLAEAERRITG